MERLEWISDDRARVRAAEGALAKRLGLAEGDVLLDFPVKTEMLGLDLPVLGRDGTVSQLTREGLPGSIDLPRLAEQLYRSARWLRVFTQERAVLTRETLEEVLGVA